jgi:DNA-binding SARP family transcriptional activator
MASWMACRWVSTSPWRVVTCSCSASTLRCLSCNSGIDVSSSWAIDAPARRAAERVSRPDHAIHAYLRALDLYRGPLFEDDSTCDWYLPEQRHLQEIYLSALELLGELFLNLDDLAKAVQAAELALTTDRCRESAHRLLMRCYARQHQQHLLSASSSSA